MRTPPRKPLLVNLAWSVALVVVLLVGYVGSYPLALRVIDQHDMPAYRPVQRLIDSGPLERPMCWWAGLWGLESEVIVTSVHRKVYAGELDGEACGWSLGR